MIEYSVVIPAYNCEDTIIDSIRSVERQTRYDLVKEIIIVNDGSKDGTAKVVEDYKNKNLQNKIILINKENGGAASARNMGIENASCDYIALLDSDDEWLPNKLEIQNDIFDKHPEIKALGTNRIGENIQYGTKIDENLYKLSCFQYCVKNWPYPSTFVFDKWLFTTECFDESFSHAEEGLFFLYIAYNSGLYYVSKELLNYGSGKAGFGVSGLSGNIKKMHEGVMHMQNIAYKMTYITFIEYLFVQFLERLKYCRRVISVRKSRNGGA